MRRSKLTQSDLDRIMNLEAIGTLAIEFDLHPSYLRKIRAGVANPKPYVPVKAAVLRSPGKPRSLSADAVAFIQSIPVWGGYRCMELMKEHGVSKATIYKVRGRKGCYA